MERDQRYQETVAAFGPALARLARSYASGDDWRDLLQDIHFALWRSMATFDDQCSLRTWVYRVAHNTAISVRLRRRGSAKHLVGLDDLDSLPSEHDTEASVGHAQAIAKLHALIRKLRSPDDQVMLLYLEDIDASSIGEITGLSSGAVATRIHRIKALLARQFAQGGAL